MVERRRCGYRKPGKAYFVVEKETLEKVKLPVLYFIQDPPEPIDMSLIATQGVTVLPRVAGFDIETMKPQYAVDAQGRVIYDVYDYVGGDYPNVADFIEEVMDQGLSRLTPRTSDYANIGIESEYRLVHPRAIIVDPKPFFKARMDTGRDKCPKNIPVHINPDEEWLDIFVNTCAGLWWECVTDYDAYQGNRKVTRNKAPGTGVYMAARPPNNVTPEYQSGIFMRFPVGKLGRWDVIKSDDNAHLEAVERLKALQSGMFKRVKVTEV
jgi:hypothetical protein